ncbi:MAG: LytTR family DNA-binding domain-containing protein [Tannerella sp.]|jgi:two-component system LytT family response regulator|nr:LytTR family DNA-binding domain-containing protein [Tannerella sp.]
MKTIIIEDEKVAAEALQTLIGEIDTTIQVAAVLQTIDESVEWFDTMPPPDLAFMDIHLADGSAFKIFEQTTVACPVIFITAYDEFALKAFEVNSIDYILKPVCAKELQRAINKFRNFKGTFDIDSKLLSGIKKPATCKSCFLIPFKDKLIPLSASDIATVFIDGKTLKIMTFDEKAYFIDSTLDEWMLQLDPSQFYRANRQYIISRQAIKDISIWFGGKLSVNLCVSTPEKVIVSKARVGHFKNWMSGLYNSSVSNFQ